MGVWLKQFWLNIKKAFGKLELKTKEDIGNYLAEKFYQDSISKQTVAKTGQERLQVISVDSVAWDNAYNTIKNGYKAFYNYIKNNDGLKIGRTIDKEAQDILIAQYVSILKQGDFNEIYEPILNSWLDEMQFSKEPGNRNQHNFDDHREYFDTLLTQLNENIDLISNKDRQTTSLN